METHDMRRGVVHSRVTRLQAIVMCSTLCLICAAYVAVGTLIRNLPARSPEWYWLDLPGFALLAWVAAAYAMWRGDGEEIAIRWQEGSPTCEIAGGSHQGTWTVLGKSSSSSDWVAAVMFLTACAAGIAALGVKELVQAHDVHGMAQGLQTLCDAAGPSLLILLNWPFRAKPFRHVVNLRRGAERMRVLI
ncbi:hypothetical protein [Alicyclobacillus mali (ex Roth et al. 2021)]|uniref:hypothetical protein n=1 Tax=Alicyclobacillus mali (ex Roth et al. 2021) TaxID=1123961 RepID=UPI001A8F604D|nr:hypothetical protein [Alicyclobacillus mali (ex Roth et al. 2021)]